MSRRAVAEERAGIELTNLDQPLYDGAGATKRELVDYLDAVSERILPPLRDRPLSVIRARPGQPPFMQKNLPRYAPDWIERVSVWAEASHRTVTYPLCHDRRTLLWLANQRAVEFHPTLLRGAEGAVTDLVIDLDPPPDAPFATVVSAARLVRQALDDAGLAGSVKTSGSKGVHILVPLDERASSEEAAVATRALAARAVRIDPQVATTAYIVADREGKVFLDPTRAMGASLAVVYGPRARPGLPVSFPVSWDELDSVVPGDFTVRSVPGLLGDRDPWVEMRPPPQRLPQELVAEGRTIPVPRVQAMHEGKRRRAAARREAAAQGGDRDGDQADS
jgi:DNA ligase D-like protein (predicted polymerase)